MGNKVKTLEKLYANMKEGGWIPKHNEKVFTGGRIDVMREEPEVRGSYRYIISAHAEDIINLFYDLGDIFYWDMNYQSKCKFYNRLADAANNYIEKNSDDPGVLTAIVKEAISYAREYYVDETILLRNGKE